jgi:RNA polymerase sigma-70 factor (ECF subfamily)
LCGIARRLIWKHLERRERYSPIEPSDNESEVESPDDDPGAALSRKETVEAVQRGIDALPAQWKEAIILCEFEEMTYEEAALVLGVPVGTVRSRLHRAKTRLALLLRGAGVSTSKENNP